MSEKFKKALRIAVNVGCGFEADAEDAAELLTLITGLESRIAELEGCIEELKKRIVELNWADRPALVGELKSRIAELEALVDELKPYRDGYDPEEVFPPEGEWVWLRDCDDNVEVMGYSQKEKCYWNYESTRMPDDGDIVRWYPIGKLPEVQE